MTERRPMKPSNLNEEIVEGFASLFRGRSDAWGKIEGGCIRQALTLEHYRRHLEGKTSLGIYPLLPSSNVNFLAIDVDLANFQVALNIRNKFKENNLNSYIEGLTKRGRYHVWLFFSGPVSAWKTRGIAIRVIGELGYDNIETLKKLDSSNPNPHVEIFPKQDEAAEVEFGNYINLPYFGNTRTILTFEQGPVPLNYSLEHIIKNTPEKLDEALGAKEGKSPTRGKPGSDEFKTLAIEKLLENCAFIQYCRDNATTLSEPLWWSMVHTLAVFGELGKAKIHKLSQPYPRYTKGETEQKIEEALKAADKDIGPHTCEFIQQDLGFPCPEDCLAKKGSLKSPAALATRLARTVGLPAIDQPTHFNLTDYGNAERLVSQFGDSLRYCYERKRWLFWTGKVWEWDWGSKIKALAKIAVRNIYHEAGGEPDGKSRKGLASHAKSSECDRRINAMISLAESEPGIPVDVSELDTSPWLFNCLNGTVDLKSEQLLPHRKEDLLTIIVPVEYHPDAPCPQWLSFLDWVTGDSRELAEYLQRAVGCSLTGDIKSQRLFFLYGLGNNGKSTFTMTIRKLLGGYGERLDADDLMLKDRNTGGGPKEYIADLKGKRYVVCSELQDGKKLDVSLIKDMTGGETIKARRLYEHDFEFAPTHKLWLFGNHKPVITDTTLSIWRRVKLIPFTVTIPDKEIDEDLPSKLEAELPGILTWAMKGCLNWQSYGLREPNAVTTATAVYRHEQDILGDFIEDCCILEASALIPKADLKGEYYRWCESNSVEPVKQHTFKTKLIEKGISSGVRWGGKKRIWKGIRLREDGITGLREDGTTGLREDGTTGLRESGATG